MVTAVISGKGGTGKTSLAVSLARSWAGAVPVVLADCDVEGPNAHHFLPGLVSDHEGPVGVPRPVIDTTLCDLCGACADVCQYHALAVLPQRVLFVESLCHGCGACRLACPRQAIAEREAEIGVLRRGRACGLRFIQGVLTVGELSGLPVVRAVLEVALRESLEDTEIILDGPPGAGCSVAEVVTAADVCLLVSEPTPFGLHDLEQAWQLVALRGKPAAVILNRATGTAADQELESWCLSQQLPLLLSIPERRALARAYAAGSPLNEALPELAEQLRALRPVLARLDVRKVSA